VKKGRLIKIGHGVYTQAAPSPVGRPPNSGQEPQCLVAEVLTFGVKTSETKLKRNYRILRTHVTLPSLTRSSIF
jgi:hypothetical protein